jgi:hypothetical protein
MLITNQYNARAKKNLTRSQIETLLGLSKYTRDRALRAFEALTDISLSTADYDLLLLVKSIVTEVKKDPDPFKMFGKDGSRGPWVVTDIPLQATF